MTTATSWGWGRPNPPKNEDIAMLRFRFDWLVGCLLGSAFAVAWVIAKVVYGESAVVPFSLSFVVFWLVSAAVLAVPVFVCFMLADSVLHAPKTPAQDVEKLISFSSKQTKKLFGPNLDKTVPFEIIYESYFRGDLDFNGDLLDALNQRAKFANFQFTVSHMKFVMNKLVPEALLHSRAQDSEQVRDHYNRGNDFYRSFLGPLMVYTGGVFLTPEDTLEQAQRQKLDIVCRKMKMKPGDKHLDIGCGWGGTMVHAAKHYGTESTGVTLAVEQVKWIDEWARREKLSHRVTPLCRDYRDMPTHVKFDKITCLEMAEHVGVKRFNAFLRQVYDALADDGLFYLQIAGLRRVWQHEDLQWGVFMDTYVFPGADASMPLAWVVGQLEYAGFEVECVDNHGIHYSATIKRWYDNWKSNREYIVEKYGQCWYRKWLWFLAWSVISPEQGSATVFQITCHKNTSAFDRKQFIGEKEIIYNTPFAEPYSIESLSSRELLA